MRLDDPRATLLNQPRHLEPGIIAILCTETTRFQQFWLNLMNLRGALPPDTVGLRVYQGSDVAMLRNGAVAEMLRDDAWKWLLFLDDDQGFRPDILAKLYARDVDIVSPICLRRQSPFYPVPTGLNGDFLHLSDYGPGDLVEVMFAGSSGMLIRKHVFEQIEPPWFEPRVGVSEDVGFCEKATEAGYKIHVDLAVRLGHGTSAVVWPDWDDEQEIWMTGFTIADGTLVRIHQVDPSVFSPPEDGEG